MRARRGPARCPGQARTRRSPAGRPSLRGRDPATAASCRWPYRPWPWSASRAPGSSGPSRRSLVADGRAGAAVACPAGRTHRAVTGRGGPGGHGHGGGPVPQHDRAGGPEGHGGLLALRAGHPAECVDPPSGLDGPGPVVGLAERGRIGVPGNAVAHLAPHDRHPQLVPDQRPHRSRGGGPAVGVTGRPRLPRGPWVLDGSWVAGGSRVVDGPWVLDGSWVAGGSRVVDGPWVLDGSWVAGGPRVADGACVADGPCVARALPVVDGPHTVGGSWPARRLRVADAGQAGLAGAALVGLGLVLQFGEPVVHLGPFVPIGRANVI